MEYSIYKVNYINRNKKVCIYDCIDNIEEADLLAQLAMNNKKNDEIIIIVPGWNMGVEDHPKQYEKALELAKKYKYEKQ
ncbi:hypothetical protein ACFHWD_03580 [Clostridium sp. MT-14]|uniref:hypothetical protein n=1 Tax=Clostridium sp. MT-14 TaxID=3348360 RepID=UPI0035F26DF9